MHKAAVALVLVSAGCNALLGIDDFENPTQTDCVGVCECRVDTDCPLSTYCNDNGIDRTCDCVAGFTRMGDEVACTWTGVLPDPDLDDDGGWTLSGAGVAFEVAPLAMQKFLVYRFETDTASRAIEMPRLARSGPLVLELAYEVLDEDGEPSRSNDEIDGGPAFAIGPRWNERGVSPIRESTVARICLGDAQYAPSESSGRGVELPFVLGVDLDSSLEGSGQRKEALGFTRAVIVPADREECTPPGTVANGDAETDAVWTLMPSPNGATAAYVDGEGDGGTRGIRLTASQYCYGSSIGNGQISFPMTGALAMRYYVAASSGSSNTLLLDDGALRGTFTGSGQPETHTYCIDPEHRGTARELGFYTVGPAAAVCGDPSTATVTLDSFAIVDEPSCGTDLAITDPGFESPYSRTYLSAVANRGTARLVTDPQLAHGGTNVVELRETLTCSSATMHRQVIIPTDPAATGGPAVAFWYRGNGTFTANGRPLSGTEQWLRGVACIDPVRAPRIGALTIRLQTATTCDAATSTTIYIDDLEAVADPGCPQ